MKEKNKKAMLVLFGVFKIILILVASILLIMDTKNEYLIIFYIVLLILNLIYTEIYKNHLKFRKGKQKIKNTSTIKVLIEFVPDIVIIFASIYTMLYMINNGISWLNILVFFLIIWFFKSSIFDLEKIYRKSSKNK